MKSRHVKIESLRSIERLTRLLNEVREVVERYHRAVCTVIVGEENCHSPRFKHEVIRKND